MKTFKNLDIYPTSYLLKMVRRIVLISFALGFLLGMTICLNKVAELKEMPIELYEMILFPGFLIILFILFFLYITRLIIPEIERRINEK